MHNRNRMLIIVSKSFEKNQNIRMNLTRRYWILAASAIFTLTGLNSCKDYSPDTPFPDVYGQTVFVSSNNQIVYAINPANAERIWKFVVDGEVHATPVLNQKALYVASTTGTVYKIDAQYGTETTKRSFGSSIVGTPYFYNNTMLLIAAGTKLHAVDPNTLDDIWVRDMGAPITASPTSHMINKIDTINVPVIFIAGTNNNVEAINSYGQVLWTFTPNEAGAFHSSPCVVNDSFLYVGNDNGKMYAVKTFDGVQKWSFSTAGQVRSSPIQIGGNVLFGSNDRNFYSVDSATGLLRWKVATADIIQSSPAVFNQNVYFGGYDQNMYCVDIIDGTVKWKQRTFGLIKSSPMIHNGDVYFGSFDKNLYRLDANTGGQKFVFNVNGQMVTSPILDTLGGAAVPSISGNYRF